MQNWMKTAIGVAGLVALLALDQLASAGPKPNRNAHPQGDLKIDDGRNKKSFSRDRAGDFDYYALVLSWSPTYCLGEGAGRDEPQCSNQRPYAFVLHGLWPQYESGYPGDCDTGGRAWVEQSTIAGIMDIMPSRNLIIHEYKKHGTCSGLAADAYFSLARKFFTGISIPAAYRAPTSELTTSPTRLAADFLKANPNIKPDGLAVDCGAGRGRLREIRFCFTRDGQSRACGKNENRARMCGAATITLPPTRG